MARPNIKLKLNSLNLKRVSNVFIGAFSTLTKGPGKNAKNRYFPIFAGLALILIPVAYLALTHTKKAEAAWYNTSWLYRKQITIDSTKVSGTGPISNFPVLISITDHDLSKKAQTGAGDILFTDAAGQKLDHEIESYDSTTGTLVAWVEVTTLSDSQDTPLYMYYGNAGASDQQNVSGTWNEGGSANFKAVWHLPEDPTVTTDCAGGAGPYAYCDSTSNNNDGTAEASMTSSDQVAGKLNGSLDFDGLNDFVASSTPDYYASTNTVSFWFKTTATDDVQPLDAEESGQKAPVHIHVNNGVVTTAIRDSGNTTITNNTGSDLYNDGNWHYVVVVRNGNDGGTVTVELYVDDQSYTPDSDTLTDTSGSALLFIGKRFRNGTSSREYEGQIDEVRISDKIRDSAWRVTEYNNQNNPGTFISVNKEETQPEGPVLYLRFNEGTGSTAYDSTGYGNNALVSGTSPTWKPSSECLNEGCMYFNGSANTATVTNNPTIDFDEQLSSELTIQTWVRANSDGENDVGEMFNKGSNTYIRTTNEGSDGLVDLEFSLDLSSSPATVTLTDGLKLNEWHHVSMSYTDDGDDEITVYIDGNLVGTSSDGDGSPATDSNDLIIGGSSSANFHGSIDEFKIYPYERSADQVKTDSLSQGGVAGASVSLGGGDEAFLTDGLVGYWKMDESSWTNDCSTNTVSDSSGNNIYLDSCPSSSGPTGGFIGKYVYSGDFDGSNYLTTQGDVSTLDITGAITISAWINPDVGGGNDTYISKWNVQNTFETSYRIMDFNAGGNHYFRFTIQPSGGDWTQADTIDSVTNFPDSPTKRWYHVVAVYDGNKMYMYVDGELEKSKSTNVTNIQNTSSPLAIGAVYNHVTGYQNMYDGQMDEVRIYKRALSSNEIAALYKWAPGPVAYWKMDEGTGLYAYDSSGKQKTGTLDSAMDNSNWINGKFGKAVLFNSASDEISIGAGFNQFDNKGGMTVGAWIRPDFGSTDSSDRFVFNSEADVTMFFGASSDDFGCRVINNLSSNVTVYTLGLNWNPGDWHYLTCLYDGSELKILWDGVEQNSAAQTGGIDTGAAGTWIGSDSGDSNTWLGAIDEVKAYDYARTPGQIVSDMNAGHPAPGSPVGSALLHFKFDEGADNTCEGGVNDVCNLGTAGSALDGYITGMSVPPTSTSGWTNDGKFGKALYFDNSDDQVTVDYDPLLDITEALTLSVWIYGKNFDGSDTYVARTNRYAIGNYANHFRFYVTPNTYIDSKDTFQALSGKGDPKYVWFNVVGTFDKAQGFKKIYVNGELQNTGSATASLNSGSGDLLIGNGQGIPGQGGPFYGIIDDVKIYNFALTDDQVRAEYNQGKGTVFGATSTTAGGSAPSYSSSREYCPPGDPDVNCDAPVGEWLFDEYNGQYAYDTSGNGFAGILGSSTAAGTNDPVWKHVGGCHQGSCLTFDGVNDVVGTSDPPGGELDFGTSTDFSITSWVKTSGDSEWQGIVEKRNDDPGEGYVVWVNDDGTVSAYIRQTASGVIATSTGTVDNGEFHFIAVTFDRSGDSQIYIDGIPDGSNSIAAIGDVSNSGNFYIGDGDINDPVSGVKEFKGEIDTVRIYDYLRTPAQIAWEYNRGGPVGYWPFDECSGTIAYDRSGNEYNGTILAGSGPNSSVGTCTGSSGEMRADGVSGKFNASLDFDGSDDYISFSSSFNITDDLTASAWISTVSTSTAQTEHTFISKDVGGCGAGIYDWFVHMYNGKARFWTSGSECTSLASQTSVNDGNWHNVVVTRTKSSGLHQIYIDGKLDASITGNTGAIDNDNSFYIGALRSNARFFPGKIDEVKIFNYILTPEQIRNNYNQGVVNFN